MLRKLLLTLALLFCTTQTHAATCFWVAGTSWNDAASWSATDVTLTGSTCAATSGIPKNAGDIASLATAAPAGVTLIQDVGTLSIAQITMSALTGSSGLDLNSNALTLTTALVNTGTGTRSLTCGTSVVTFTRAGGNLIDQTTTTNFTMSCASASFVFATTATGSRNAVLGTTDLTYPAITIGTNSSKGIMSFQAAGTGVHTITSISATGPATIAFQSGRTFVVTNGMSLSGSSLSNQISLIVQDTTSTTTISSANNHTLANGSLLGITFVGGGGMTATNALDLGANSVSGGGSLSITPPTVGGGFIIGG